MKLTHMLASAVIAGSMPMFAMAAEHEMDPASMTCADFTGMDAEGQEEAYASLEQASMEAEAGGDTEAAAEGDAEMAEGDDTEAAAEGDAEMAEGGDTEAGAEGEVSEDVQMLVDACEGNDDMMAMEAMETAMGG